MTLYVVTVTILIHSKALGDPSAKAEWHDSRTYKFDEALQREEFVERIEKVNREMRKELKLDTDIFTITDGFIEHADAVDEAVRDVLHRFAHLALE